MQNNTLPISQDLEDRLKVLRGLRLPEEMASLVVAQKGSTPRTRDECILGFISKILIAPSGCWIWTGAKTCSGPSGHGLVSFMGKNWLTHRLAYFIYSGTDPETGHVCHHCDNPPCVKPEHLYLGTPKTNGRDKAIRNRVNALKGDKHPRSILTENDAAFIINNHKPHIFTVPMLADKFGVSCGAVDKIIYGGNWKHLKSGKRSVANVPTPI